MIKSVPVLLRKAVLVAEDDTTGINDAWFNHPDTFDTYKKPAIEPYEIATRSGTVSTLEGPVKYVVGHYIMTGSKGEKYPISAEKFATLKDDNGDGTCSPKKIMKRARLADHDGVIHTSWGDLNYTAGNDYIVRHSTGDYGAVKKDIFNTTYTL